jgi:succinate dehydrogenase / fumarate reductase cytochrome b subunit
MEHKNEKRVRPLSPHLGIYKPQISSVLSIGHRISGVFNFLGLLAFVWWIVCVTFSPSSPMESWVWTFFSSFLGISILVAWSFSMFFHFCTGIRHLFWHAGFGFSVKAMTMSGWFTVIMSVLLTVITWLIILNIA